MYVESAGVRVGEIDHFAIAVMEEMGMDISDHQPHSISDLYDTSFDTVITLTPRAHHQALEMTRTMAVDVIYWPTMDPTLATGSREQRLDEYRACRDFLFRQIKSFLDFAVMPSV
jgi:protein-tyrosine-phosphatase